MGNNDNRRLNRNDHAKIEKAARTLKKGIAYAGGIIITAGTLAKEVDWANVANTLENTSAKVIDVVRKIK